MSYETEYDLPSMLKCIRSSMGVPGITGGLMARASVPSESKEEEGGGDAPLHHILSLWVSVIPAIKDSFAPTMMEGG